MSHNVSFNQIYPVNCGKKRTYLAKKTEGICCWKRPFGDELIRDETPFLRTKPTVAAMFVDMVLRL